ncbi:uncharacterized protein LOC108241248 isoform X2 [Kryptolebias marmoratus]|uniref:uncharacterized protein LOC108241248 isoform X2 n=1 Tax=Kryptolebias marmoratus TaxID=37003 RepID=UPI0007F89A95|nr:uncharacterized protein LOC108241248 isoform X2 [Kryptolebias marmoratus]
MNFKIGLIVFVFISSCFGQTSGCNLINITCNDILKADGYRFSHGCPVGSEVFIHDSNKTLIAYVSSGKKTFGRLLEVEEIDNHSVTTKSCRDLTVKCIITNDFIEERCLYLKAIENTDPNPKPDPDPDHDSKLKTALIICIGIGIVVFTLVGWYVQWKKEQKSQDGNGFQLVRTRDLESQSNGNIRNGNYLSQSGENDPDDILETVCSRNTGTPNITSHSNHRPMHRNQRDDPGGENGTKTRNMIRSRDADGGQTAGHLKAEDSETERQLLLSDQPAADRGLDVTNEAEALVNKAGFGYVSRCSSAPNIDVESGHKEEPIT